LALFPLRARGRGSNRNDTGAECAFPGNHPDLQQADERRPRRNQPQIRPLDNERLTALAQASEESGLSVEEIVPAEVSEFLVDLQDQEDRSCNRQFFRLRARS
jgi:hypothetical protein